MRTLTITAKGQVTLRQDVLQHLGVAPGQKVVVDKLPEGRIALRAAAGGNITHTFDFLKRKDGPALSVDEIKSIASRGWAGRR
jgi:bifunctional DNA-binding transcriptional regulator/antitoxin component of YhaV-PrlF toxin-antitoxin module